MALHYNFPATYAAGATSTPLLSVTGEIGSPSSWVLIKITAITDDTTTVPVQAIDRSYGALWNGTTFVGLLTNIAGEASAVYGWAVVGATATFRITPLGGSPAGNVYVNYMFLPNSHNFTVRTF